MTNSQSKIALGILLAAHLLAGVLIALGDADGGGEDFIIALVLGTVYGQTSLTAIWAALGTQRFSVRWPLALFTAAISWICLFAFLLKAAGREAPYFIIVIAGVLLVQWLAVQTPPWVVRLVSGWRIGRPDAPSARSASHEVQFGIKQLLLWTGGVAVLLGIARVFLPDDELTDGDELRRIFTIFGLFTAFNTVIALPVFWGSLVRRYVVIWLLAGAVYVAVFAGIEMVVFAWAVSGGPDAYFWWLMNGVQFGWLVGSLLVLRMCGYRLVDPQAALLDKSK